MPLPAPSSPGLPTRHLLCVVAARPNFMKMAPILAALAQLRPAVRVTLVHTGQHYDAVMNGDFFTALDMRPPDINLDVGHPVPNHALLHALLHDLDGPKWPR